MNLTKKHKYSVVVCARWEENYVVEWLNYYRAIGYDHVYVYCNDDDPYLLYEKLLPYILQQNAFVTFKFWEETGAQFEMYLDFIENHKDETEFVSFFDIDEFLRLSNFRTINEFVQNLSEKVPEGFDCVYFNWCMFGNNGFEKRPEGSVLASYTKREKFFSQFMTKHITRTNKLYFGNFRRGPMTDFWHYWNGVDNFSEIRIVNPIGENVRDYYDDIERTRLKISSEEYFNAMLGTAVVHHYVFKSKEDFILRARRSTQGVFAQQSDYAKAYHDGRADQILSRLNEVEDNFLKNFWVDYLKESYKHRVQEVPLCYAPSAAEDIISFRKQATQSSVSQWSSSQDVELDARGAVNGIKDGRGKFHTSLDASPWWRVDLGEVVGVSEVRIYNRIDVPEVMARASRLAIDLGFDAAQLTEVYRRESDQPFGGVDGNPLVFKPSIPIPARFVRIRLLTPNFLHLDQVEVYGQPLPFSLAEAENVESGVG